MIQEATKNTHFLTVCETALFNAYLYVRLIQSVYVYVCMFFTVNVRAIYDIFSLAAP